MMTSEEFTQMALSFFGAVAAPHFGRTAFKVTGKRIFATLHDRSQTANLKFSPADQSVYSLIDRQAIYRVNNKWGLQGWTTFEISKIKNEVMSDALETAYKDASGSSGNK